VCVREREREREGEEVEGGSACVRADLLPDLAVGTKWGAVKYLWLIALIIRWESVVRW
jgi:hypothetical protein